MGKPNIAPGYCTDRISEEPNPLPASAFSGGRLARLTIRAALDGKVTEARAAEILGVSGEDLRDRMADALEDMLAEARAALKGEDQSPRKEGTK